MKTFAAAEAAELDYSGADGVFELPHARTQTLPIRCCSIAVFYSPLPLVYLKEKEGVPVRSKASQREGLGDVQKVQTWLNPLNRLKMSMLFYILKGTEE